MPVVSIYHKDTGVVLRVVECPIDTEAMQLTTPDERLFNGFVDMRYQCVDVNTGEIVEAIPPQPDETWQWNEDQKRWVSAHERNLKIQTEIEDLEKGQQRALREVSINVDQIQAKERLTMTEQRIVELRAQLEPTKPPARR